LGHVKLFFYPKHKQFVFFFYFGLYLDCIKVYLDFNYNYILVLTEKKIKKLYFFN